MTRVVFDTGVVVSALLFSQRPATRLRSHWQSRRSTILVSAATVEELLRVLAYPKFGLAAKDIEALLGEYLPFTTPVHVPRRRRTSVPVCRNPEDQKFLDLAAAGKAEILISGDRDLLALAGKAPFAIETIVTYLGRFTAGG